VNTKQAAHLVCCKENRTLRVADDPKSADRLAAMTNTLANEYQHYPARKDLKEFFELGLRKIGAEKATEKTTAFLEDFPRNEVLRIPALRKFLRS
jgi:hypothetical protein